jgi:Trk-type K+ transport system membrane component
MIVIGGIGFPVIINFYNYFKSVLIRATRHFIEREEYRHSARVFNTNTKIVVSTTAILLLIGFITFFAFEYNHTLKGLSWYGKIVTTIFGAVTPRTAGFNTVDMTALTLPTVLIYLILMWIGASPGSTGGGLKTTTFAVAVLNAFSIAKGKDRVEAFRRQITNESVRKAFAVILLSFLVIGFAVFLVMFFDPEKELIAVAFECFSAFSTVGLSLGITGDLTTGSKIVIIITMFLGRVGTLTMLIAFFQKVKSLNYRYPDESVFIS